MTATITPLVERFEAATRNSIRNGHPPFGELLAQFKNLNPDDQNAVLNCFCRVWMQAADPVSAADQYVEFVSQPWLSHELTAKLIRVTHKLASTAVSTGQYHVAWAMRDAAWAHIDLVDAIDQATRSFHSSHTRGLSAA